MKKLAFACSLFISALVGCSSSGEADFVLETNVTPLTDAEQLNIEGALADPRDLAFVGRVVGPQGESVLVTFGQGPYDECYAVFESAGVSSGCGSLEPPGGSVIVGQTYNDGYIGLVLDTSREGITSIRVATGTGETYEVAPISDLSFVTFEDTQAGFELSVLAGDDVVHQEP